jgi:uridine phosphorylase
MFEHHQYLYIYMRDAAFMINPEDIKKNALAKGIKKQDLDIPADVILTFNRTIVEELVRLCDLRGTEWAAGKFTPYSLPRESWQGNFGGIELRVFVPPMGASPLAAFCEELVSVGARRIFLLCASWSLGETFLKKGQIHLPSFAIGFDGTSCHYGNDKFMSSAESVTFDALKEVLERSGADWRVGGVGCCEALYRITAEMVADYRRKGCLSMENGEVAVLYCLAKLRKIEVGVLLQPYLDLEHGLDPSYMDDKYEATCRIQAHIALEALKMLHKTNP